jgi:hypothetical protein
LDNESRLGQILFCEVRKRGAKSDQGSPDTLSILVRTLDPQIDVARRTREPVSGNRVRSNEHELNFLFAKREQYVAEV